ncbi:hypothetical protein ACLOJK_038179 [Asimina triloba]
MRVITWNQSMASDDCGVTRESDTLAMVMDKSRAWEKKLLEEVKTSEVLKVEYQRKVASLATRQKTGSNAAALQKAIAAASHLQSRPLIAAQSMDAIIIQPSSFESVVQQYTPKIINQDSRNQHPLESSFVQRKRN